jgi:hypothetical protein
LDPSEPKGLFSKKRTLFFHVRPSIRQNCFSSWHQKIRASGCAQTPCIFSHKSYINAIWLQFGAF